MPLFFVGAWHAQVRIESCPTGRGSVVVLTAQPNICVCATVSRAHIQRTEEKKKNGVDCDRSHAQPKVFSQGKAHKARTRKREGHRGPRGASLSLTGQAPCMGRRGRGTEQREGQEHSHEMRKKRERERAMGGRHMGGMLKHACLGFFLSLPSFPPSSSLPSFLCL